MLVLKMGKNINNFLAAVLLCAASSCTTKNQQEETSPVEWKRSPDELALINFLFPGKLRSSKEYDPVDNTAYCSFYNEEMDFIVGCNAVLVTKRGHLLTAAHCVDSSYDLIGENLQTLGPLLGDCMQPSMGGSVYPIKALKYSLEDDIALLKTEELPTAWIFNDMEIDIGSFAEKGDAVNLISYRPDKYDQMFLRIAPGKITDNIGDEHARGGSLITTDITACEGDSGSGLYRNKHLLGIISGGPEAGKTISEERGGKSAFAGTEAIEDLIKNYFGVE